MKVVVAILTLLLSNGFTRLTAETVDFGFAFIDLPKDSYNNPRRGIDSAVGIITSTDGTPAIHYDVGQGPDTAPAINVADYLFLKTGKLNGYDYYATIHKTDPHTLSFYLIKPIFAGFWATVNTDQDRDRVLKLLSRLTIRNEVESKQ